MRKRVCQLTGPTFLLAMCLVGGALNDAAAQVSVNVNLGPPPVVVSEPPELVMVPNSDVYFVPEYNFDLFLLWRLLVVATRGSLVSIPGL